MKEVRKITPKGDITWWVKWIASIILLVGLTLTANNIYPLNLLFMIVGTTAWAWVGFVWHDRSLLLLNGASCIIAFSGLISYFIGE